MRICNSLNLKQKRELVLYREKNQQLPVKSVARWATEFFQINVLPSTVSRILKKKGEYLSMDGTDMRKRKKDGHNPQVEEALYRWFVAVRESKISVSDDLLITKARILHERMLNANHPLIDCGYTTGWISGFKKRFGIKMRVPHGEGGSVQLTESVWDRIHAIKAAIVGYEVRDVFNMDETGLFYKLAPNRTLADSVVSGEKRGKERLTVGLCANMDGSIKLPPLVINKSLKPRAFTHRSVRNPENLGLEWYANRKAWMTGEVFSKWLLRFDTTMACRGRKNVLLLLDNAPSHISGHLQLKVTKVLFLPPLTTSHFQPMDAGIIRSFKAQYRKQFVQKQIADFEIGVVSKIDVYDACLMIVRAWKSLVTTETIANCWRHCGLVPHADDRPSRIERNLDLNEAVLEDSDLSHQVNALTSLLEKLALQFPVNLNMEEYISVDDGNHAPCFEAEDLLAIEPLDVNALDENDQEEEPTAFTPPISVRTAVDSLEIVATFLEQCEEDTNGLHSHVQTLRAAIGRKLYSNNSQITLHSFYDSV